MGYCYSVDMLQLYWWDIVIALICYSYINGILFYHLFVAVLLVGYCYNIDMLPLYWWDIVIALICCSYISGILL